MLAVDTNACTVAVSPPDAPDDWRVAAEHLRARLREEGDVTDCGGIEIEVAADRAFVVFATRDGRQTVRQVRAPDEVAPVVAALLVTLPKASTPQATASSADDFHALAAPAERTAAGPTSVSVVLRTSGAARLSAPGGFASPSFLAGAGLLVGPWELGLQALWDPVQKPLTGSAPANFAMQRYAIGITAGRRWSFGPLSLASGLIAALEVTNETAGDGDVLSTRGAPLVDEIGGATAMEPLSGAYLAVVYPRRSRLRGRAELSAEAVVSRFGHTRTIDPVLPALPWWDASASVGVEWEPP